MELGTVNDTKGVYSRECAAWSGQERGLSTAGELVRKHCVGVRKAGRRKARQKNRFIG